jgi:endonuclease/exonuclease/phosphatase family metal-dependent hydrolase
LGILETQGEFVLTGDFNAPRMHKGNPGEIFSAIASRYTDNIPVHYETSIDASLHRNGKTRPLDFVDKMVDGLFTTPVYTAHDVGLHFGVSDHAAVSAIISKD